MRARLSSSRSELFGGTYARGEVAAAVSDRAWVQAMLDVEAALGGPAVDAGTIDIAELGAEGAEHVSVVVPLARRFAETHRGATSQDILDTAMMLIAARARVPLLADLDRAAAAAADLARRHRDDPCMGLTLLQPALPTSFGLRAAGWMVAIDEARADLAAYAPAVQMGGPVGRREPAVAERIAATLDLEVPLLAWHTDRVRVARLAGILGTVAGVLAKVARDVTLTPYLAEGNPDPTRPRGGSSAMAHKRNPVAAVSVLACARRTPGLVATLLASLESEQERAAGAWQAEWGTLTDLWTFSGSAASWAADLLGHLKVDAAAMAAEAGPDPDLGASGELVDRALEKMGR